jgi:hypothetical protein
MLIDYRKMVKSVDVTELPDEVYFGTWDGKILSIPFLDDTLSIPVNKSSSISQKVKVFVVNGAAIFEGEQ